MIDANLFQIDKSQVSGYLADTISCRILLALPLAGTSPGIATSSLRCSLSSPVACLSLCSPVFCHLESSGRSCNSSWGSNGCGCSRLAVSRPISYAFVSTPFFLRSCGKVSSFGHQLRLSSSLSSLSILLLNLLRISVEEQVRHNFPRHVSADGSPQSEYLSCQHPPHQTQTLRAFVVARNSNIDELGWRVHVTECHDRDIGVGSFSNRLMVGSGIANKKDSRLTEGCLNLVSKCPRSETTSNGAASNISCKLKNSSLSIWSACNHINILGVLYCSNCASSKDQLFPGLPQVDNVDPILPLLEDVLLHCSLTVVRSNVRSSSQHLGDVIFGNC